MKNLLIVESPSKCKTIAKYLGKDFTVMASVGHIREIPTTKDALDRETFDVKYVISPDKEDVVKGLKEAVKKAENVYWSSDYDREGESISWHLQEVLNVPKSKCKRITFTEITKKALEEALAHPRDIDMALVHAQQSRQILDRIIGFDFSGLLFSKVQKGASGGRVQSIAAKLIKTRFDEFQSFNAESSYKVTGTFEVKDKKGKLHQIKATLNKKFNNKKEAKSFLEKCIDKEFFIKDITKKEGRRKSPAPFTTSTMQQDAIRKLGMSVDRVTVAAQSLYMQGFTTYIRSDSVTMSDDALNASETEIKREYGDEYSNKRQHQSKNKNSQEAHECIRPSYFDKHEVDGTSDEKRLYELIWKRAVASQMSDCIVENTTITIGCKELKEEFIKKGVVVVFDGYTKVYAIETADDADEEDESGVLPDVKKGEQALTIQVNGDETFNKPKPLFNEASLIKEMETLGVGRPSTVNSVFKVLYKRQYVEEKSIPAIKKEVCHITLEGKNITEKTTTEKFDAQNKKLVPTELCKAVVKYLEDNFAEFMKYEYTSKMELLLDSIAENNVDHLKVLKEFYKPFSELVKKARGAEGSGSGRLLGEHKGKPVYARLGKFGPMIQFGDSEKPEKGKKKTDKTKSDVRFASIPKDKPMDDITLDDAIKLLAWPKVIGQYKKHDIEIFKEGKFGPYLKHNKVFVSIKDPLNPETITLDEATELIKIKESGGGSSNVIKKFSDTLKILNGQYGAYIKFKDKNIKIPAQYTADTLTEAECKEIIGEAKANPPKKKKWSKKK